jgi:hypothetical protein
MELAAVRQSTSWRLTAPLRQAGKRLREYGAAAGKVISRATSLIGTALVAASPAAL